MGERHKHADVIHAWAEGEEIEYRVNNSYCWQPTEWPDFSPLQEFRVKPKIVKKEGWIARLYSGNVQCDFPHTSTSGVYNSLQSLRDKYPSALSYHHITWEEQ